MTRIQNRKRLARDLRGKYGVFERIGQSTYNEAISKICAVMTELACVKKRELISAVQEEYGTQGIASSRACVPAWARSIVDNVFNDGYQPVLEAVLNAVADPSDNNEEVNFMNKAKGFLAVAIETHKRGEGEIAQQIFAEAMKQGDLDIGIKEMGLTLFKHQCESCGSTYEKADKYCRACGDKVSGSRTSSRTSSRTGTRTDSRISSRTGTGSRRERQAVRSFVITPEARKKFVSIANDIAAKDGGKFKDIARKLLQVTREK